MPAAATVEEVAAPARARLAHLATIVRTPYASAVRGPSTRGRIFAGQPGHLERQAQREHPGDAQSDGRTADGPAADVPPAMTARGQPIAQIRAPGSPSGTSGPRPGTG